MDTYTRWPSSYCSRHPVEPLGSNGGCQTCAAEAVERRAIERGDVPLPEALMRSGALEGGRVNRTLARVFARLRAHRTTRIPGGRR